MHATARLTLNTFWNIVGQAIPVAAAVLAIPFLIDKLGQERFGALTMVWVVVGYSGLFDFGVGRALTTLVAGALGSGRARDVPTLVWTSLSIMFILGSIGGTALSIAGPWFVRHLLKISPGLTWEIIKGVWVLAAALPVIIVSTGLTGILEASQRFDLINAVRAPLGVASYIGPLVVAFFLPNLVAIAVFLGATRIAAGIIYLLMCRRVQPELNHKPVLSRSVVPRLLTLGGWMTVSNLISPLMASIDRFFVGSLISATAVAYYGTVQDVVSRSAFIPVALAGALFPSFAGASVTNRQFNVNLFGRALDYMFLIAFPLAVLLVGFADDGLLLWLGKDFACAAAMPLEILACGMFVNSLARIPFTFLQAVCRPDLTAKAHLLELPLYLAILVGLTRLLGINGVAIAWSLRTLGDALILFLLGLHITPGLWSAIRRLGLLTLLACLALGLLTVPSPRVVHYGVLAMVLALYAYLGWTLLLTAAEQQLLTRIGERWWRMLIPCATPTDTRS